MKKLTDSTGPAVAPMNVSATSVSSTVISVEWGDLTPCRLINGLIVKFTVQYRKVQGHRVWNVEVSNDSDWNISLTGLTSSTNYSIRVAAVNENGDVGQYSTPVIAETCTQDTPKSQLCYGVFYSNYVTKNHS